MLRLAGRGIEARGRDAAEGFIVYAGSQAAKTETAGLNDYVRKLRAVLLASGVLVDTGPTLTVLQDYTFASPSTAAGAMLGRTANGRTEWKDALGRSLKAIQDAAASG